jgi:hypothetical protein
MTRELRAAASVIPWTDRQERTVAVEETQRTGASGVAGDVLPDVELLRSQVREKYRQVAVQPAERDVMDEIHRALRPGGVLQFADIANGRPVPSEALRDVDLWTG